MLDSTFSWEFEAHSHVGDLAVSVRGEQDVGGLDVSVDVPEAVDVVQPEKDLRRIELGLIELKRSLPQVSEKGATRADVEEEMDSFLAVEGVLEPQDERRIGDRQELHLVQAHPAGTVPPESLLRKLLHGENRLRVALFHGHDSPVRAVAQLAQHLEVLLLHALGAPHALHEQLELRALEEGAVEGPKHLEHLLVALVKQGALEIPVLDAKGHFVDREGVRPWPRPRLALLVVGFSLLDRDLAQGGESQLGVLLARRNGQAIVVHLVHKVDALPMAPLSHELREEVGAEGMGPDVAEARKFFPEFLELHRPRPESPRAQASMLLLSVRWRQRIPPFRPAARAHR
mmetsp:Transcript_4619/g.8773  ORF Transcript_4619/g.8773 Transcript_4619/m.8773 type:complete len:344 (+) Transcript_4619:854-1885(+)